MTTSKKETNTTTTAATPEESKEAAYNQLVQYTRDLIKKHTKLQEEYKQLQGYNGLTRLEFLFKFLAADFTRDLVSSSVKLKAIREIISCLDLEEKDVEETKKCTKCKEATCETSEEEKETV